MSTRRTRGLSAQESASESLLRVVRRADALIARAAHLSGTETPEQVAARQAVEDVRRREARLRRRARSVGLRLVKSRSRTTITGAYGTYGLLAADTNAWVATRGGDGYGLDLDAIEAELGEREALP